MNYKKLYYKFIAEFKKQCIPNGVYTEIHHILPKYKGGKDVPENLVRLTYRQHVFVHRLWAKATNDPQAILAYRLMSGIEKDKRLAVSRLGGQINAESGHLDRIRHLANTKERQRKLKLLNERKKRDGTDKLHCKIMREAWRGKHHTEAYKQNKSKRYKKKYLEDESYVDSINRMRALAIQSKRDKSKALSDGVLEKAERNKEWLDKKSKKSKNIFVSPEGLEFDSPIYAANYYGNIQPHVIENWCKREQHGWKRIPKRK